MDTAAKIQNSFYYHYLEYNKYLYTSSNTTGRHSIYTRGSIQCTTKASHSIAFLQFVTMWPWPFVWPNINCWARSWWTISVPSLAILVSAVLVLSCRHTHTHTESDAANRLTRAVCLESQTSTKKLPQGRVNMLRATKWGPSCLSQTFPSQNGPCMEMPISTAHSPQLDTSRSCNPQTRDQCIV